MTPAMLLLEPPGVAEARERFNRSRLPVLYGTGFSAWHANFRSGLKFESIAHDFDVGVDTVRRCWRHFFKAFLAAARAEAMKNLKNAHFAQAMQRQLAGGKQYAAIRLLIDYAQAAGCSYTTLNWEYRVVKNRLIVEGCSVVIYETWTTYKNKQRPSNARVSFHVNRDQLLQNRYVALVAHTRIPLIFLLESAHILDAYFQNPAKEQKQFTVATRPPTGGRHPAKKIDFWRYQGEAVRTLLASLKGQTTPPAQTD